MGVPRCPECGAKNRAERTRCRKCDAALATTPAPAAPGATAAAAATGAVLSQEEAFEEAERELTDAKVGMSDPGDAAPLPTVVASSAAPPTAPKRKRARARDGDRPQDGAERRPAAPPRWLHTLGLSNIVFAALWALLALYLLSDSVDALAAHGAGSDVAASALHVEMVVTVILAAALVFGGVGLLKDNPTGRTWSFVFAGGSFAVVLLAAVVAQIANNVETRSGEPFEFHAGAPLFAPVYGIALLVLLNRAPVKAWARGDIVDEGRAARGRGGRVAPKLHGPAVVSLVLSLTPFALIPQIIGLIVGIVALKRIRESRGKLEGRGYAVAGVTISSIILGFMAALGVFLLSVSK